MIRLLLAVVLCGIDPGLARAEPETAKLVTDDALTNGESVLEVEASWAFDTATRRFDADGDSTNRRHIRGNTWATEFSWGLCDTIDVSFNLGRAMVVDKGAADEHEHVTADTQAAIKWLFFADPDDSLFAAARFTLIPDTGSGIDEDAFNAGQEYWSAEPALVVTRSWTRWTATSELAFGVPFGPDRDSARGDLQAGGAVGYQLLPWLQPELELVWQQSYLRGERDTQQLSVVGGAQLNLSERWRLGVGARHAVYGRETNVVSSVLASLTGTF